MNSIYNTIKFGFEFETFLHSGLHDKNSSISTEVESEQLQNYITLNGIINVQTANMLDGLLSTDEDSDNDIDFDIPIFKETFNWIIDTDFSVIINPNDDQNSMLYTRLDRKRVSKNTLNIREGFEIISPPFVLNQQPSTFNIISRFMNMFNEKSCNAFKSYHNKETSTHIHYSFDNIYNRDNVFKILMAWWYFEPTLLKLVPFWRRKNYFCRPIRDSLYSKFTEKAIDTLFAAKYSFIKECIFTSNIETIPFQQLNEENALKLLVATFQFDGTSGDKLRTKTLNLFNLILPSSNTGKPLGTMEVRIKHGSVDDNELKMYINLYAKFFDAALRLGENFFNTIAYTNGSRQFTVKDILINQSIDFDIHLALLRNFIQDDTIIDYFKSNKDKYLSSDYSGVFPEEVVSTTLPNINGGKTSIKNKIKKTSDKINYKGKNRSIYIGNRGGKYIKYKKSLLLLSNLKL